jgi:phosphate transport system substrate-binding protein
MKTFWGGITSILLFAFSACSPADTKDNPTRGTIRIASDESFRPVIHALTNAYEGIYPKAHFEVEYLAEQRAILALLQDSARMVFVTRTLDSREDQMLLQQSSTAKTHRIAIDGIALVTAGSNKGALISTKELAAIFKGSIKNWEQLSHSKTTGPISLVFDDANSSNLLHLMKRFDIQDLTGLRLSVAGSHEQVIEHVKKNPGAIGFVGMSWISDGKEAAAIELSQDLYVMGVGNDEAKDAANDYFFPFQDDLKARNYPLSRDLYAISREAYSGLGGGLLTYIARDVGGLIIMKMGLVPVVTYHREMFLKSE